MNRRVVSALAVVCLLTPAVHATLSGNIVTAGSFEGAGFNGVDTSGENLSFIKLEDSPRTAPEVAGNLDPVRAWQFHPGGVAAEDAGGYTTGQSFTDMGKWIGTWGIDTVPDVRNPLLIPSPSHNRSIVTRNGSPTGIMEGTAFRMGVSQFIEAPQNIASTGNAQLDYDYFFRYWEGGTGSSGDIATLDSTPQILRVQVFGLEDGELPTYLDRFNPTGGYYNAVLSLINDYGWDLLYAGPDFNSQSHSGYLSGTSATAFVPGAPIGTPDDQVWKTLSDGVTAISGTLASPGPNTYYDGSFPIDKAYKHFYVFAYMVTYSEPHPYFWLYGRPPADTMSVAIDNISLQVPLANLRPTYNPGDFNLDGLVNVQDINPFVTALGSTANYKTYVAGRLLTLGFDNSASEVDAVYAEVDPNQSGAINVQDINPFVGFLAGAGVDTTSLIIPEPASLSLLTLGGLALLSRRR